MFFFKLHVLQEQLLKTYNSDVVKSLHQCSFENMEKFTREPRRLLFPVVTVGAVTGWDAT
jgi:hypothetical protein